LTKALQKYVIVMLQSGARPVYSPVAGLKIRGLFWLWSLLPGHVRKETGAVMQARYDWVPLSRTICRQVLSIRNTTTLVPVPVARTSSTVVSAGAWKNGSVKVSVLQLVKLSMPTESATTPVPLLVNDATINVWDGAGDSVFGTGRESVHVSPFAHLSPSILNVPEVTGVMTVPGAAVAVAVSWKSFPFVSMLRSVNLAAPSTAVTVIVPDSPDPLVRATEI
jgi:hypothetical protein